MKTANRVHGRRIPAPRLTLAAATLVALGLALPGGAALSLLARLFG